MHKKNALVDCYDSGFRFSHERVRKAIQALIPEAEIKEVHRSMATALEADG